MSQTITLKGIAWDHPRGYEPLLATSKAFAELYQGVSIKWNIRSLKEFGDMPVESLIENYDLITIDHPFMGQADANKLLLPLEDKLTKSQIDNLKRQSVGPSFESYRYNGHLYALPIDAASLFAASRNDLILSLNLELPQMRSALFNFYKKVPNGFKVAWPLCPTDLWCTFLTLCAQDGGRNFIKDFKLNETVGIEVLNELIEHLNYLHSESLNWNPVQVLDHMKTNDEIIYSPYLFGYTNYSRLGFTKNNINFSNSPTNPKNNVSTILGGVGLAVSAKSKHAEIAVTYASYVAKGETQEGIYTENGGQPGNLLAWHNAANNRLCNNFFNHTLKTMEMAYVRPQHPGWNQFQEKGAALLHSGLVKNISSTNLVKELNLLYRSLV